MLDAIVAGQRDPKALASWPAAACAATRGTALHPARLARTPNARRKLQRYIWLPRHPACLRTMT
jgi:hypothetical protein